MQVFSLCQLERQKKKKKIKEQVFSGCCYLVYAIDQPIAHMWIKFFNFVGLTEKCDKKINVLEFERKKIKEIKE